MRSPFAAHCRLPARLATPPYVFADLGLLPHSGTRLSSYADKPWT